MRVEKNIFVDGNYIASQNGLVAVSETFMGAINKVLEKVFEARNRVVKLRVIHFDAQIVCGCDDPSCPGDGEEGEVANHIEDCTCGDCHHAMGKISG